MVVEALAQLVVMCVIHSHAEIAVLPLGCCEEQV
jgi:hypothetical protein